MLAKQSFEVKALIELCGSFFSFPVLADSRGYYYTFFCPSLAIWGTITKEEGKNRNWKKEFSSGIIWQWLKRILSGSDLSFWLHAGVCCPRGYSNVVWLCCWNSWEIIPLKNPCCVLKTNIISGHSTGVCGICTHKTPHKTKITRCYYPCYPFSL